MAAAEAAAETIRAEAESRARDRIAESNRAVEYRVSAAEEEAAEIMATARSEAKRLRTEGRREAQQAIKSSDERGQDDPRHRPPDLRRDAREGHRGGR